MSEPDPAARGEPATAAARRSIAAAGKTMWAFLDRIDAMLALTDDAPPLGAVRADVPDTAVPDVRRRVDDLRTQLVSLAAELDAWPQALSARRAIEADADAGWVVASDLPRALPGFGTIDPRLGAVVEIRAARLAEAFAALATVVRDAAISAERDGDTE